jgi:hypothetical protein
MQSSIGAQSPNEFIQLSSQNAGYIKANYQVMQKV